MYWDGPYICLGESLSRIPVTKEGWSVAFKLSDTVAVQFVYVCIQLFVICIVETGIQKFGRHMDSVNEIIMKSTDTWLA